MYRAIAIGFFTVATILGALWAADAWGAYWQWDPKETWALIVWLNYAAWLHMRLIKGLRGTMAAYWALTGLLITGFAFLGVNMYGPAFLRPALIGRDCASKSPMRGFLLSAAPGCPADAVLARQGSRGGRDDRLLLFLLLGGRRRLAIGRRHV